MSIAGEVLVDGLSCYFVRCARLGGLSDVAVRKFDQLHSVSRLDELRIPPKNKLERLERDRKGQWSIRINDQYRVCFRWDDENAYDAYDVEITDYH